jgi:hypothetical protein
MRQPYQKGLLNSHGITFSVFRTVREGFFAQGYNLGKTAFAVNGTEGEEM